MGPQSNTLLLALLLVCLLSLMLVHASQEKSSSNNKKNNNKRAGRSGKQGQRCKNRTTFTLLVSDLKRKSLTLKCARGPVVGTQLLGIKGQCQGTTGFTRWTEGRCLWNQTCHVTFQDQVIDSLDPKVKDKSCLGQVPDTLQLRYTCLKRKATVLDTLGSFQRTRRKWGVIRSHKMFPWSYRNGQELGNVTMLKPRKPASLHTLWISVHLYSVRPTDIVFLNWEERPPGGRGGGPVHIRALRQITANDTLISLPGALAVNLTLYVDYRHHARPADGEQEKGFLLCYQWLKAKGRPKKDSACSKVMMPAKCKNKRGGRGRKAGNSRPRNNKGLRNNQQLRNDNKQPRNNNKQPRNDNKQPRNNNKQPRNNNKRPRNNNKRARNNNKRARNSQ